MDSFVTVPVASAAEFEAWLMEHGASASEIWVEIFKKSSKLQTVTFDELLDMAICYGWIDVKTKGIDERRYAIRFVPRKPGSNWSAINRERVRYLLDEGRMTDAGISLLPDELKPA
ncbi:MAG: hypothetical protein IT335_08575 [Thermomicrobiales bacterium]|jgi:uncharacterized protein YdeI (YjbR/CyaY-like superfamily)|nr:hypothetical protein [Thermomicrobiales bacterium]